MTPPRLGRVESALEPCRCAHVRSPHAATYRFERVDERGLVYREFMCLQRAAAEAHRYQITWPAGPWKETT